MRSRIRGVKDARVRLWPAGSPFARPGHYLVRVEGTGHGGTKAVAHLHVHVEAKGAAAARRRAGVEPAGVEDN
jgi:hypothetical protein